MFYSTRNYDTIWSFLGCDVHVNASESSQTNPPGHIEFMKTWPCVDKQHFLRDMLVIEDFLSADEEAALVAEVDPYMQKLRYEFDHWDDVSTEHLL